MPGNVSSKYMCAYRCACAFFSIGVPFSLHFRYFCKHLFAIMDEKHVAVVKDYGVTGDCATCLKIDELEQRTDICPRESQKLKSLKDGENKPPHVTRTIILYITEHFNYIRQYRCFIDSLEAKSSDYFHYENESNEMFIEQVRNYHSCVLIALT